MNEMNIKICYIVIITELYEIIILLFLIWGVKNDAVHILSNRQIVIEEK